MVEQDHRSTSAQTVDNKKCSVCKHDIPPTASLCSICRSYQQRWKNELQYYSGIAALLVLFLSASSWLIGRASAYFQRDDIRVISCNTLGAAVIANRGKAEVFISNLLLWMPGRKSDWEAPTLDINEGLPSGQFLKRQFPASRLQGPAFFVRGVDSVSFEKLISRAAKDDPCFELAFFESSDHSLRELKQMAGPTLNTFDVAGYLEYFGTHSDTAKYLSLSGTGVVRQDARAACK